MVLTSMSESALNIQAPPASDVLVSPPKLGKAEREAANNNKNSNTAVDDAAVIASSLDDVAVVASSLESVTIATTEQTSQPSAAPTDTADTTTITTTLSQAEEDAKMLSELAGGGMASNLAGSNSLQANFARFRGERAREKKMKKQLAAKKAENTAPRTQAEKDLLRAKFVAQAKSYMGVPYHPSYHRSTDSPYHDAPLYLDCCGLVRRTLQDLASDFGFQIGRWNQAYQFECCPVEMKEEELKPGDLIFTAGT
jgi:cell wall-associated NlpC family hydrolase